MKNGADASDREGRLGGRRAVLVFLCFAAAYFMSYSLRSVNAVIAPDLIRQFRLSHAQLGSLSSAYFLSFAAMQLPLGIWLDRFGARRTHATLLLIGAAGCLLFAGADDVAALWAGRALIGVGVAGALMSALKGFRFWYAPTRQQPLSAWMLVAGTLGALAVTVPVEKALPLLGWRGVFAVAGGLVFAAALAIWFGLPKDEERSLVAARRAATAGGGATGAGAPGYLEVFSSPHFWRFALQAVVFQSSFYSLQTLWIGPWFVEVLGMAPSESARALLAFNLVLMFAYLALGWAMPRIERHGWGVARLNAVVSVLLIVSQLAIALARAPWAWLLWLPYGLFAAPLITVQPHLGTSFRREVTGRAYTALNLMLFCGIFLHQWIFGVCVDLFRAGGASAADAFTRTMLAWQVLQVAALAQFLLWKTRAPVSAP